MTPISSDPNNSSIFQVWFSTFEVMVFNATFNNISLISWPSVLFVKETGVPEKKTTDLLQVIDKLFLIILCRVQLAMSQIRSHTVFGYIHAITTKMVLC